MKYKCPCCGYYTFDKKVEGNYEICPVCFWEDDPTQMADPLCEGGANKNNLMQARRNYLEFGACEKEVIPYVRKYYEHESNGIE